MATKGQMIDMYKQLEEVMKKCDSLSQEIKVVKKQTSQKYIKEIKQMKKEHKEEVYALNQIKKVFLIIEKNQIKRLVFKKVIKDIIYLKRLLKIK